MDIVDEIKREIARTELLNDMAEGMTAPKSTAMLTAAISEIERLRTAIGTVCEGWTLPPGARKVLETALWAETVPNAIELTGAASPRPSWTNC